MKKNVFIFALIALFQLNVSAQSNHTGAIAIDGNSYEWNRPFELYNSKSELMYAIANDNTNLFFCFICTNKQKMVQMMKAGWTIELISNEKNRKFDATIDFPVQEMPINLNQEEHGYMNGNTVINTYKLHTFSITTQGFKTKNGNVPLFDSTGIKVALGADSTQNIVYEIAIPLKELADTKLLTFDEKISMKITINELDLNGNSHKGKKINDGKGGRKQEGGRVSSRSEDDESRDFNNSFSKRKFKETFHLTKK